MNKINVGVIGVGAMGHNHARVYHSLDEANLVAVSDVTETTLTQISNKYDVRGFLDYNDILNMKEIDAVSVCVPTTHHYKIVMDAIEHGKHVLVEKPIAFTLDEAKSMVKSAKENNIKIATGHVERFNPAVQKAKKLINDGVIGDIVSATARRVGPFPPRIKDVGVSIDLAIHDLDVMYYLFNEPVTEVYATMGSILENCEYEDHAEIMTKFDSGITGILEVNWLTPYKRRELEITGTDGIISIDYINQSLDVYGKFAKDVLVAHEEPLKNEIKSYIDSIKNDTKPEITGEDGIHALRTVIAAMNSSKTHNVIKLNTKSVLD